MIGFNKMRYKARAVVFGLFSVVTVVFKNNRPAPVVFGCQVDNRMTTEKLPFWAYLAGILKL